MTITGAGIWEKSSLHSHLWKNNTSGIEALALTSGAGFGGVVVAFSHIPGIVKCSNFSIKSNFQPDMIREDKIPDENGNGFYTIFYSPDFEYINPINHFMETSIRRRTSVMRDILTINAPHIPQVYVEKFIYKEALKEWSKDLSEIMNTPVSENLIKILDTSSKNEQIKLLKGVSITPKELCAFIVKAWTDFGYSYSQYTSEHHHNGLDRRELPKLIEVKDGKINKIGRTKLTEGQLKQAVEHRKVIVSKFIGNDTVWHCLFITYDSLKGKEAWKGGQPHYHYISDKFGFTKQQVVAQLKSRKYSLGNLPHIDLLGYNDEGKA